MGGPVAPSGRPLVPNQFLITIPAGQNGRIAQDGFQFLLAGEATFDYVSEVSEDLTLWLLFSTNRITDVRLPVTIHDRPAANLEKRFYRVRPLPALP